MKSNPYKLTYEDVGEFITFDHPLYNQPISGIIETIDYVVRASEHRTTIAVDLKVNDTWYQFQRSENAS